MDFELTEEQKIIQDTAAKFAKRELEPVAAELDQTKNREILKANLRKLAELGFMGLNVDPAYGGTGAGVVSFSLAMTELGRACASTAVTTSVTNMVAEVIQVVGTEEQKQKYIPPLCSGEWAAGSFGLTETCAGSDPASMRTSAVLDGDEYVLNGGKIFITSAEYAGVFVVWAVTDKEVKKGKGITAFLVEPSFPGFIVGKDEKKMGQHASSTNELRFENCRVPKENVLGKVNDGFRIAVSELAGGRIGIGSMALGIGLAAMDCATAYAKERIQFDKPISNLQAIQWMIADNYTRLEASQLLLLRAASLKDQKKPYAKEASMAKVYATESANKACYDALQILGGYGYTADFPVERFTRDVRITSIYEGTSEIQRLIIARDLLK
ncbi:acyl-CoA dehydrogenase family protein [Desulforhabdus amnigena]|jgi:butyryl-CoA dehydrogenase|uniref:Cyclohex-1-ene-1-carbonyl-CoA dehydrogenase n=1 Tax=Desulforhabdus amnigena TaxID=40218 RepID=A0A9W6D302_9BACT|nr:acyl-CoA dehydrogenase family protein [Desulforhabdus amnigena]NLJ28998.1 acyl-CoA dehydrogenase [Deltaproteobacteria bacterium]GLI33653.1 acyl-CoA dehydrogenase [Desulforhabdus amnigena]